MIIYEESDCIHLLAVTCKVQREAYNMLDNAIITTGTGTLNGHPSHTYSVFFPAKTAN